VFLSDSLKLIFAEDVFGNTIGFVVGSLLTLADSLVVCDDAGAEEFPLPLFLLHDTKRSRIPTRDRIFDRFIKAPFVEKMNITEKNNFHSFHCLDRCPEKSLANFYMNFRWL
jgi:hypothetical protein